MHSFNKQLQIGNNDNIMYHNRAKAIKINGLWSPSKYDWIRVPNQITEDIDDGRVVHGQQHPQAEILPRIGFVVGNFTI